MTEKGEQVEVTEEVAQDMDQVEVTEEELQGEDQVEVAEEEVAGKGMREVEVRGEETTERTTGYICQGKEVDQKVLKEERGVEDMVKEEEGAM